MSAPSRTLASNARLGFSFSVPAHAAVDPTKETFSRLASVNTLEELEVILHPPDLFTGYSSKEEIYTTVKRRLTEIAESATTYLQLAAEEDCEPFCCGLGCE